MGMIVAFGGIFYLFTAYYFFLTWLDLIFPNFNFNFYYQEDSLILKDVLIAALLWPVVAPFVDVHLFK
ncbi:MAG: hypothetical protein Fur006_21980 [Coleofasciculaceae cyanobacterium]